MSMCYRVAKDSSKGKIIISQAVVIKVLGICPKDCYSLDKRSPWLFDIVRHGYGRIDVKYSCSAGIGRTKGYRFQTNRKIGMRIGNKREYDTYFFLGYHGWDDIDAAYIIPNKGWIKNISMASIYENSSDSKYDEFKVDARLYNDAYHDFISFIGGSTIVGIDDVKMWLNGSKEDGEVVKNG